MCGGKRSLSPAFFVVAVRDRAAFARRQVSVETTATQKYAAWFGGSCLAADPAFKDACHSRADYMEHGARIVRSTQGFA